jgi:hypothetical protein
MRVMLSISGQTADSFATSIPRPQYIREIIRIRYGPPSAARFGIRRRVLAAIGRSSCALELPQLFRKKRQKSAILLKPEKKFTAISRVELL